MEKILLGAYLSVLAAFLTAAASIVKLVNEKESKTTDYRQSWTDSVRTSFSQLIASITLQASYLIVRHDIAENLSSAHKRKASTDEEKTKDAITSYLKEQLSELNSSVRENRQEIQKNYALTRLHFKPNDETFSRIEQKFDSLDQMLIDLAALNTPDKASDRASLKEKITSGVSELTLTARFILKTEWEHVKAGEPAYKKTKNWSLYIGISTFSVLILSGIYMLAYAQIKLSGPDTENVRGPQLTQRPKDDIRAPNEIHQNLVVTQLPCIPSTAKPTQKPKTTCSQPSAPSASSAR